ncbi:MAG: LytTR family DNA-binding domain-containing protein [Coprobacillus sp.]
MKIICLDEHREQLEKRLQRYSYLDIVLVEKGIDFQGMAYIFDILRFHELEEYLQSVETSTFILYGKKNDRIYKIDIHQIIYIEGFSKETYIRTKDNQYEIKEKLYELEEKLLDYGFARVSKSLIINCRMIKSLEPLMNMRYRIHLKNGEYVNLTRAYTKSFKSYLKMR